jgi:parallel beta-helix repeat protein
MPAIDRRNALAFATVALVGVLAIVQGRLADRRPAAAEDRVADEWVVTSGADRGDGSLREAIFAADTANGRVRILVRAARIELRSPLPPLVNPKGISIEAGLDEVIVDLSGVGSGAAIEVRGGHSQIIGVTLANAPGQALRIAAPDFRLAKGRVIGNADGVVAGEGSGGFLIEQMRFEGNATGVRIEAVEGQATVRDNHFTGHKEAALWAVRPADATTAAGSVLAITGNHFEGDRVSVVAGNTPLALEKNEFVRSREFAVMLLGGGATVRANQVRDGEGIGIVAHDAPRALIEGNDIGRNRALGLLVRNSPGATVRGNRVYGNGYGMAFVLGESGNPVAVVDNAVLSQRYDGIVVIGDSPMVRGNRTLNNGLAGLRVMDVSSRAAARILALPFLEGNTVSGNLLNEVVRGDYRVETEKAEP